MTQSVCARTTTTTHKDSGRLAEVLVELYEDFSEAIKEPLSATNDEANEIQELLVDFNKETLWMTYENQFYTIKIDIYNIAVKGSK